MSAFTPDDADAALIAGFESQALAHIEWSHRAHVRMAYLYVRLHGYEEGLNRFRDGVQKLNAVHKVPESPVRGYNETTTVAFMRIMAATVAAYEPEMPTTSSEQFCDLHTQLMTKHIMRLYYSPARRMDPRAKYEFVEPDLAPLPQPA